MKRVLTLFFVLFSMASASLMAQDVEDLFGISNLKFNGTKYQLGWSAHNSTNIIQEYFPKGQVPESYTDMFTVYVNTAPKQTPKMAVEAKVAELSQRKEKSKDVWNWATCSSPDGSECIIDFICCSGSADALEIVEFDVHKYRMIEYDGYPALQLVFYSHRVYGDDIMPFMKDKLADLRLESINALIKFNADCKATKTKTN